MILQPGMVWSGVVHLFGEKVSKIFFCLLCWDLWLSRRFLFVFAFFHLASEIMKVVIIFLLNIGMVKLQSVYIFVVDACSVHGL